MLLAGGRCSKSTALSPPPPDRSSSGLLLTAAGARSSLAFRKGTFTVTLMLTAKGAQCPGGSGALPALQSGSERDAIGNSGGRHYPAKCRANLLARCVPADCPRRVRAWKMGPAICAGAESHPSRSAGSHRSCRLARAVRHARFDLATLVPCSATTPRNPTGRRGESAFVTATFISRPLEAGA